MKNLYVELINLGLSVESNSMKKEVVYDLINELDLNYDNVISSIETRIENTEDSEELDKLFEEKNDFIEVCNDEIKTNLDNINKYGCIRGCVPSMAYYYDTDKFFDKHVDIILELVNQLNYNDYPLENLDFSRNSLSWLAYETICREISDELEIW
ncbi:MAG: hypothetical protein RR359_05885 [Bacilli bacterium]